MSRPIQVTIPEPYEDVASLRATALATKELVEVLAGQRGKGGSNAVTQDDLAAALGTGIGSKVSKAGDTVPGDLSLTGAVGISGPLTANNTTVFYTQAGYIGQGGGGSFMLQCPASNQAFMTFHIPGAFAGNFGLSTNARLHIGGWSWGANTYQMWCAADFANPACDYRIKEKIEPLPSMWDKVKALKPVKYTTKDFTPPAPKARSAQMRKDAKSSVKEIPHVVADDTERWGLIAHEVQEALIETAANGVKDDPEIIQTPTALPILAALTKALQEAMARIEALEANG